jgi:threonine/homoserine/homoserine lactone efflux protein
LATLHLAAGPLALFALVASITPGPNNLLLMRSGAQFGVNRTLWHALGVQIGFVGLIVLSWLGVGALLLALPLAFTVLRWLCFAYLLWLAWMVLRDGRAQGPVPATGSQGRPMRCVEAILFQLINPKAWMMSVTAVSAFYGGAAPGAADIGAAIMICVPIGATSMMIWTAWGAAFHRLLAKPRARQLFSYAMAALVVISAVWMLR